MFTDIQRDIEGAFASSDWQAREVPTYPQGYDVESNEEFVRVNLTLGEARNFYDSDSITGRANIQIYVPSGRGSTRALEIADYIDEVLKNKVFDNGTQTKASSVQILGNVPDNPSLFLATYSVPLTYFNRS